MRRNPLEANMRKNLIICSLVLISLLLTSCNNSNSSNDLSSTNPASIQKQDIFERAIPQEHESFEILDKIGGKYIGLGKKQDESGITYKDLIYDIKTGEFNELKYPPTLPDWTVATPSYAVFKDKYLYEWKSYSQASDFHEVKLTCTNIETGEVSVVAEKKLNTPFVWICKLSEDSFLSYYLTTIDSDKTEYATVTVAEIFDLQGNSKEIIREKYENDKSWSNSDGTLIERVTTYNGKIYGIGRKNIYGTYPYFLYEYDKDGTMLSTKSLKGLGDIIDNEMPNLFHIVGDYMIIQTYATLTYYIFKITDENVELIAKDDVGKLHYGIYNNIIYYTESNVNRFSGISDYNSRPIYMINTESGTTRAIEWEAPFEEAYFYAFKTLSDGDLLLIYCEKELDPMKTIQFIAPKEKLSIPDATMEDLQSGTSLKQM
jgi:hypothetical protein